MNYNRISSCLHHASTVSKHFFIIPTDAHNYKITEMLKQLKIPIIAPTCFGPRRNHHPSSTVYCTLAHRLVCRHDIDHVSNDKHNRTIIVVLAKHEIAP